MTYKILTEIHHDDVGENSPALQQMEIRLKAAMAELALLRAPGPAAPAGTPGSVARLRGVFERTARVSEVEQAITLCKRQITQMGGTADGTGRVTQRGGRALVFYDHTLEEKGLTRTQIVGGLLYKSDGTTRIDTTTMRNPYATDDGYGIYVLSAQGNLHVSDQEVHRRHHSSLLAGISVAGAGEIRVANGTVTGITNRSGHYLPSIDHFLQVIHHLQRRLVQLDTQATITYVYDGGGGIPYNPPGSVGAFLRAYHLDDDSYEWNNLLYAYSPLLLDAALLAGQGWDYRPGGVNGAGVYTIGTNNKADLHQVRVFLRGRGTAYVQRTADAHFTTANPARPAARPHTP